MSKMIIVEGNSNDKDNVRVIMVKGEKGEQGDLNHNDIVDNLTSTATNKVLSAKQGKVLKDLIDANETTAENTYATKDELNSETITRENANSNLQNQISGLASGSPLVASSVSGMTDTSKIYVNTSDGNWYYYNGSSWSVGGVYQSTGISDNSIAPSNLKFVKRTNQLFNYFEADIVHLFTDSQNMKIYDSYASYMAVLPITGGQTYSVSRIGGKKFCIATTENYPTNNENIIDISGDSGDTNVTTLTITASNNANYLCIFYLNSNADPNVSEDNVRKSIMVNTGSTSLKLEPYVYIDIDNNIEKSSLSNDKLLLNWLYLYSGFININFDNNKINVIGADSLLSANGDKRYLFDENINTEIDINLGPVAYLTATIENDKIVSLQLEHYNENRDITHPIILAIFKTERFWYSPVDYGNRIRVTNYLADNFLTGKKMGGMGDSLIYGSNIGNTYTSLYLISKRNNMTYVNYGINGNPISQPSNYDGNGMCVRYINMADDLDYIVILGGANDYRLNVPIGNNTDTVNTTFKGALNTLIQGLLTKYPGKKILFMTNYNRVQASNSLGLSDIDYVDAMLEMCGLYGIPCFDNYRKCGISWHTNLQESWADEGVYLGGSANRHLSPAGYEFLVPVYENILKSI